MKSINKMRIIYPAEFNAEKEYLKTFFDYIGILVYDEKILNSKYHDVWYKHLKINNDPDGVDIVLNYYTDDAVPVPPYNKRIYLYFDLEQKICDITTKPVPNPYYLANYESANIPKKVLRSEMLDLLIDEIWQDDLKNKDAIKLIKECYIPKNKDSDLFYILQAIYSCIDVCGSYIINSHNEQMEETGQKKIIDTELWLYDYVIKFFEELWRVQCLLNDNDSPYAIYTTINNAKLLLWLYNHLSEYQKGNVSYISYNNTPLQIDLDRDITDKMYKLINNCPWFTKAIYMVISYNVESENIYEYLLNCCSKSSFPIYYAPVYNSLGYKYMQARRNYKEAVGMFRTALEIAPNNYDANFRTALLETCEGHFEAGEHFFNNCIMNLGTDNILFLNNKYNDLFSLSELFKSYQADIMISKIAINSCREYTARARINEALRYAEHYEEIPLIKRIADNDEKEYQDFMRYHKYSTPVYILYCYLKPWINGITNDYNSRKTLQKRLQKYDSN